MPRRIVSLLPSATEIAFAIGAGADVVGITHECDFPPEAQSLPRLTASALPAAGTAAEIDRHVRKALHQGSSLYSLDSELLEELAPDLIITQELCAVCAVSYGIVAKAARRLTSDPRIISLEPSSIEDLYANIATVGDLTDHAAGAASLVASLRAREAVVRSRTSNAAHRSRTLVLEWTDPPMSGGHWTPEIVEAAGGECLLGNPGANSQVLSWDAIAKADADVIIVAPCGFDEPAARRCIGELSQNSVWNGLRAVRQGTVHAVDGNAYVNRPGPRLIDTMEIFERVLTR